MNTKLKMNKKISYEDELNSVQLEAVKSIDGAYLVIAGAGSGKTRVLVYRVAYLVEQGVSPENILLLTFTRKAAAQMLNGASRILDNRCQRVSGGTFHSFANMVLRKYASCLDLPNNFTILDQADAQNAVKAVRLKLGFNKLDKKFPQKKALLDIISKSVNKSSPVEVILHSEYPQFYEWLDEIKKVKAEYIKYKRQNISLDYDDLLVFLEELLANHEDVCAKLQARYKYVMVDEYQDTNKIQARIVYLLACQHKNVMVVGDDSQSIYSFRGANFKNIIDFPKIFPQTKSITLEENYRSIQPILDLTNEVINCAPTRFEKRLFTNKGGSKLPLYVEVPNENSQSQYIVDKIEQLRQAGVSLDEIAVLFRSGWHSNDLEIQLANRGIPFVKYGGIKFVEAAHIKDIISYLRIAYNIFDEVSWQRVLLLMRGVGIKTAQRIIEEITAGKKEFLLDEKTLKKSADLRELIELLKQTDINKHTPVEILKSFLEYYQPLLKEKYDDFNKRINDLLSLEGIAARYESMQSFLTDMALEPPEKSIVDAGTENSNKSHVTLSTIHSAKGLEWHTVFLIYVAEGHIPSYLSMDDSEAIEEERRLFYVAATRAKENLFLLRPQIDRSFKSFSNSRDSIFTEISRFLEEGDILSNFLNVETSTDSLGYSYQADEFDNKVDKELFF